MQICTFLSFFVVVCLLWANSAGLKLWRSENSGHSIFIGGRGGRSPPSPLSPPPSGIDAGGCGLGLIYNVKLKDAQRQTDSYRMSLALQGCGWATDPTAEPAGDVIRYPDLTGALRLIG